MRLPLVFAFVLSLGAHAAQEDPAKPNILFIAVDDLRPELGCYGTRALTPHIDHLAKSGLQFDRAYCNQAVCGASRVSLMTGLYPERTGERSYHVTDWRKRWSDTVTLNQHFTENGYTTVGMGKIYHGSGSSGVDRENWSEWIKVGGQLYALPENLQAMKTYKRGEKGSRRGASTECADTPDETYTDGQRANAGAEQLLKLSKQDKPFFLAVGFTKPHLPFVAPKKYWDLYQREDFSLPPNLGIPPGYPEYASNKMAGEARAYNDIPESDAPSEWPDALNKRLIHGYHASVSYMDRNVGVLLDALKRSGAEENTIVVFWADHGWKLGDHTSWCKHTNFECDNRVPLIIRHPGMKSATGSTKALTELIDVYPTLCELAGLTPPEHLQGRSLASVLADPLKSHRDSAYSSYPHSAGKGQRVTGHSIRTKQYRYTEWWEHGTDKVVDFILTDIAADPGETSAVEGKAELKEQLSVRLRNRVLDARQPSS